MFALRIINKKSKITKNISLGLSYTIEKYQDFLILSSSNEELTSLNIKSSDLEAKDYYIVTSSGTTYEKLKLK